MSSPIYSFYIPGTGWTPPENIGTSAVDHDVFTVYIPSTGQFIAAWGDSTNNLYPTYSLYTPGMGWSSINTITLTSSVSENVFLSLDSLTGTILATWADSATAYPMYSFYTPGTGWGPVNTITTSSQSNSDIVTSFDPTSGNFMATWPDGNSPYYPTYSVYIPGMGWGPPSSISVDSINFIDVYNSFDPTTGKTVAIWQDGNSSAPTYSFYTPGTGWSPISTIPGSSTVVYDVIPCFNPATGQFLAAWGDSSNMNAATYSVYTDGAGWSAPARITPVSLVNFNLYLSYDPATQQILGTWDDTSNNAYPTYSFFQGASAAAPSAPAGFSGDVVKTRFLTQTDRINQLKWAPANDSTVVQYLLRRNGVLIYTAPFAGPYSYEDHNRHKKTTDVYTLTSQNQSGTESSALTVTFR
ncbi:MAG TPA: hypothetical protein VMR37_01565 [Rhabdochlamydiaceae bacterium]|nr:hypothetical protein [Rhabdochlamydiaceae bacterium]